MAEKTPNPTTPPSHIPGASDPNAMVYMTPEQMAAAEVPAGTDALGPEGSTVPRSRSFTNVPSTFDQPGWTYVSPEGQKFVVNKGGLESSGYLPGKAPGDLGFSPGYTSDPRLGMAPQGEWTLDRMRNLFPEAFDQKFQEKYREIDPANLSGTTAPDGSPIAPAPMTRNAVPTEADRDRFEAIVFKQIGNPFLIDVSADLRRADGDKPQVFKAVFGNSAVYEDLAKLSLDKLKHWESEWQAHRGRVKEWSVNRKKQAMDQYEYMMAKYDRHAKELQVAGAKADKEAAAELARAGKAPTTLEMTNEMGKATIHMWDPTLINPSNGTKGWWKDTGRTKDEAPFMPPNIKVAMDFVTKYSKMDPQMAAIAGMLAATGQKNDKIDAMFATGRQAVPEGLRWQYDNYLAWWTDWEKKNNAFVKTPEASAAAPAKRTADDAIKAIVEIKQNGGKISNAALALFRSKYGDEEYAKLNAALASPGVAKPPGTVSPTTSTPGAVGAPTITKGDTKPVERIKVRELIEGFGPDFMAQAAQYQKDTKSGKIKSEDELKKMFEKLGVATTLVQDIAKWLWSDWVVWADVINDSILNLEIPFTSRK